MRDRDGICLNCGKKVNRVYKSQYELGIEEGKLRAIEELRIKLDLERNAHLEAIKKIDIALAFLP